MTSSRLLRFAQIAVFVACLGVPLALYAAGARSEPVDNRRPTARPSAAVSGLFDTGTTAAFDAYFDDVFPLRDEAIQVNARIDRALGDSSNPDVVRGRDGWLFLRDSLDQPCRTAAEIAELEAAYDRADRLVRATGRTLVNVIAPDKASVFGDRLASSPTCVVRNAERLAELDTAATVVMAFGETQAVAAMDDRAYRRLDTHWTTRGATPSARATIDLLAPGRWNDDAISFADERDSEGDLSRLLGLPESEPEVRGRAAPAPGATTVTELPFLDRDGAVVERIVVARYESGWDGAIAGPTVMLHDSFGDRFVELTGPYFADAVAIGDPSPRRSGAAVAAAERIIRIEVQRLVHPNVVTTDLAAELAVALRAELPPVTVDGDCASACVVVGPPETYLIATLLPGEQSASIALGDRRFELDALTPAAAWFVDRTAAITLTGDVERVAVGAVAVP